MGVVATAAVGAYSAYSSAKASKRAAASGDAAAAMQYEVAMRQEDRAYDQWRRYKKIFAPIEKQIANEAKEGPKYGLAESRASADVAQAFDKSNAITQRSATRYGIDPSSGRFADVMTKGNNLRGLAEVDAMNRSRMAEDDKAWAKKLAAVELGKGLPAQSASLMNSASAGYGNAASNMYGMAGQYANSAGKGMQVAGNAMSNIDWDKAGGWFGGSSSGGNEPWNNSDLV